MALNHLKVRTRLLAGFLLLACLGAIVAAIGVYNLGRMHDEEQAMYERELLGLSFIKEANITLISIGRLRGSYLLAADDGQRRKLLQDRAGLERALDDKLAGARPRFVTERAGQLFDQIAALSKDYRTAQDKFYQLAAAEEDGRSPALAQANDAVMAIGNRLADALRELSEQKEARAKAQQEHGAQLYERSRTLMIALVVLALGASVALGLSITRSITGPLDEAVALARKVAAGDLTASVDARSTDEIGQLMKALSEMTRALASIVGQVRDGTETIGTASSQIAAGNMDLSSRTEQQAGALQQTRSSMEELTGAVRQNAAAAAEANALAQQAAAVALKGGDAVAEVVSTMTGIEAAARRIADIIGVIDGIAFQTNILALNAAVEAARAGEQGRGFAVVATEVRGLAARSAEAARQIKDLITDSVGQVDNGAQLVSQAGATMRQVVDSIQRVTDLMGGIADASSAQSAGIEQVHQAIAHMDDMTQQNASLVEEAAAAAQSLHDQADDLKRAVSTFRVGADALGAPAPAVPAPRRRAGLAMAPALAG